MRKATTIKPIMWKKRSFTKLPPDAKLVFLLLATGPETNLGGLVSYSADEIALFTSLAPGRVKSAMAALVDAGRILWDEEEGVVLILRWIKHNPLVNDKLIKGAISSIAPYENHKFHETAISIIQGGSPDRVSTPYTDGIHTSQGQGQGKGSKKNKDMKEEYNNMAREVLDYLNTVTGRRLGYTKTIEACFKRERCTVEDCKLVIDYKYREWAGTEFVKFVNAETPWLAKNFQKYLDEAKAGPGNADVTSEAAAEARMARLREKYGEAI